MTAKKPPLLHEAPTKQINELLERSVEEVDIKVIRRTADGRLSTIKPSMVWRTIDLLNGKLEEFLTAYSGGGEYQVQIREMHTFQPLAPRYKIILLGSPFNPKAANTVAAMGGMPTAPMGGPMAAALGGYPPRPAMVNIGGVMVPAGAVGATGIAMPMATAPGQVSPPPQADIPPWARSLGYHEQWHEYYRGMRETGKIKADPSTTIAQGYAQTFDTRNQHAQQELAMLRERGMQEQRRHEKDMQAVRDEINQLKMKSEQEKSDAKLDVVRAELAALRNAPAVKPSFDWAGFAALAVPVLPALMTALATKSQNERQAQLDTMKLHQSSNNAMVTAITKKDSGSLDWVKLTPLLLPLAAEVFKSFGPAAKAEAQAQSDETKMMLLKMVADAQIEKARAEGDVPTWLPLVSSLVDALPDMAQGFMAGKAGGMPQLPAGAGGAPSSPTGHGTVEDDAPIWAQLREIDAHAAQMTQLVFSQLGPETQLLSHEWRMILFNLHHRLDAEEMVELLVDHLTHCEKFAMMPPPFEGTFVNPEEVFARVIGILPIGQPAPTGDPEYAQTIIVGAGAAIRELIDEKNAEEAAARGQEPAVPPPTAATSHPNVIDATGAATPPNGAGQAAPAEEDVDDDPPLNQAPPVPVSMG